MSQSISNVVSVVSIIRTCGGCPERFEGDLSDGRKFSIKCRWGHLSVWIDDQKCKGITYPDDYTGMTEDGDLKKLFFINDIEFNVIEVPDDEELADL